LCVIMPVFVDMFIFWIFHGWEKTWQPLSFWAWLTSLNVMSSSCIHLPSNHMSFFLITEFSPQNTLFKKWTWEFIKIEHTVNFKMQRIQTI
jgi:hypothetical protein